VYDVAKGGAVAEVPTQRRHDRAGARRLAVAFGLLGEEVANVFGLDRRDVDGVIAKPRGQEPTHDAQCHCLGRTGQTAHAQHVLAVAAKFVIHRCPAHDRWGDCAMRTKHHQQMRQRGAHTGAVAVNRTEAMAGRKVPVQEFNKHRLVDALNVHAAPVNPLGEVGDTAHATGETATGVSPFRQVVLEGIDVRCQGPLAEPVDRPDLRLSDVSHDGLLR
jgi:hypothetical protein